MEFGQEGGQDIYLRIQLVRAGRARRRLLDAPRCCRWGTVGSSMMDRRLGRRCGGWERGWA